MILSLCEHSNPHTFQVILIIYCVCTCIALVQNFGTCTHTLALATVSKTPWKDPNIWSNFAFLFVGILVMIMRPNLQSTAVGCSLLLVFVGSLLFHIVETSTTLILDRIGMCSILSVIVVILFHIEQDSTEPKALEFIKWFCISLLGVVSCNRGIGKLWVMYRLAVIVFALYVAIHRKNIYIGVGLVCCVLGDLIACIKVVEIWFLRICGISGHAWKHVLIAIGIGLLAFA
jgi:hypothetical protein